MDQTDNRKLVTEIFYASLKSVDPYVSVKSHAVKIRSAFTNGNFNRLLVAGFGKAACSMSNAIEDGLGDIIDQGIVITKYGHIKEQGARPACRTGRGKGRKLKYLKRDTRCRM